MQHHEHWVPLISLGSCMKQTPTRHIVLLHVLASGSVRPYARVMLRHKTLHKPPHLHGNESHDHVCWGWLGWQSLLEDLAKPLLVTGCAWFFGQMVAISATLKDCNGHHETASRYTTLYLWASDGDSHEVLTYARVSLESARWVCFDDAYLNNLNHTVPAQPLPQHAQEVAAVHATDGIGWSEV